MVKPKKIKSAFLFFVQDNMVRFRQEMIIPGAPNPSQADIMKKASEVWKEMTDEQKDPYNRLQDGDRIRKANEKQSLQRG